MRDDERVIDDGDSPDNMPGEDDAHGELVYDERSDEIDFEDDGEDELEAEGELDMGAEADAAAAEAEAQCEPKVVAPVFNNFMDVLYPANPPAAKNARIVRRFDLEAAKYDPRPATPAPAPAAGPAPAAMAEPAPAPEKKEPALTREEMRAMRNRSLRAAAGLG